MEKIRQLYLDYSDSKDYIFNIPDVQAAEKEFEEFFRQLDQQTYNKIEEQCSAVAAAWEMQGFINGFKHAVDILTACGVPNKLEVTNY